jgi:hypothetical protein
MEIEYSVFEFIAREKMTTASGGPDLHIKTVSQVEKKCKRKIKGAAKYPMTAPRCTILKIVAVVSVLPRHWPKTFILISVLYR